MGNWGGLRVWWRMGRGPQKLWGRELRVSKASAPKSMVRARSSLGSWEGNNDLLAPSLLPSSSGTAAAQGAQTTRPQGSRTLLLFRRRVSVRQGRAQSCWLSCHSW